MVVSLVELATLTLMRVRVFPWHDGSQPTSSGIEF
jgi:hypothetical protein